MTRFSLTYLSYIRSEAWRKRRTRALKLAGYKCQLCNSPERLEVHHNTYERLGHEADSDLTVLCAPCHRGVTWMLRARRFVRKVYKNLYKS